MIVLGIHAFIHDSGACVIHDGNVCAISEERLDRKKHSAEFPALSVEYTLKEAGLKNIHDVDLIVYDMFERQGAETLRGILSLGYRGRIESIRHHDAHAASAYFCSPFNHAAVLVVDGAGSNGEEYPPGTPPHYLANVLGWMQEAQSFYRGSGNSLHLVKRTFATPEHAMGIGFLYGITCEFLGFDKLDGGKLMGLAAYGNRKRGLKNPFIDTDGDMLIPMNRRHILLEDWKYLSAKLYGCTPRRPPNKKMLQTHKNTARFVQEVTEQRMLELAIHLRNITGAENICLAGGVALNGPANSLIARKAGFKGIFIQPASNDCGIPLGCAQYGSHIILGEKRRFRMKNAFLGKEYNKREIHSAIIRRKGEVSSFKPDNMARHAALAIASGNIIGLFHGRSEFGPRALGNRSILADPRNPRMKDILNATVKFREQFRPYAPAVLDEYADVFFDSPVPSPYMLMIVETKKNKAKLIPAALHVDGSARIQSVDKTNYPLLHRIIREFQKLTGIPMVINTSMNISGEPIAETPDDAINCLLKSGMGMLLIGDHIVEKKNPD